MVTLYSMQSSGNCYKVRLLTAHLKLDMRLVDIDVFKGESRTPDFLMKNPNGKIPLLELPGGRFLAESDAMLVYLAEGSPLLPRERFERALVLQWMFFEQFSLEPSIAQAHHWLVLAKGGRELKKNQIDDWVERGYSALSVMDRHLANVRFFAGERFSVADIALYAYTHLAPQDEFDLRPFGHVRQWLKRVSGLPGHVDMAWRPKGAVPLGGGEPEGAVGALSGRK